MRRHVFLVMFVLLAPACRQIASTGVKTESMKVSFSAVSQGSEGGCGCGGDTISVNGTIRQDGEVNTYISMAASENLTVTYESDSATFKEGSVFNATDFSASVSMEEPQHDLVIALTRDSSMKSAPRTVVKMPKGYSIKSVSPDKNASRSKSDVTISWDTPTDSEEPMTWHASGSCIDGADGEVPPYSSNVVIPMGTLTGPPGTENAACAVTFEFNRTATGSVDPAFASESDFTAVQRRKTTIDMKP